MIANTQIISNKIDSESVYLLKYMQKIYLALQTGKNHLQETFRTFLI